MLLVCITDEAFILPLLEDHTTYPTKTVKNIYGIVIITRTACVLKMHFVEYDPRMKLILSNILLSNFNIWNNAILCILQLIIISMLISTLIGIAFYTIMYLLSYSRLHIDHI